MKFVDITAETYGESAVTAAKKKRVFLTDVGFGSKVLTKPIELIKGAWHEDGQTILNVPPE